MVQVAPPRTLHAFCHTFSIHYLRKGGSVFHLQKVLGHSSLEMTRRYANLMTEDLQAVYERVSMLFRKHLLADYVGRGGLGTQPDLHRETETPKASQLMVSTTFPPPLFGCVFGAKKWHTLFQHAVKNDQHMMSHRDNRAFLATPWC